MRLTAPLAFVQSAIYGVEQPPPITIFYHCHFNGLLYSFLGGNFTRT